MIMTILKMSSLFEESLKGDVSSISGIIYFLCLYKVCFISLDYTHVYISLNKFNSLLI